MDIPVNSTPIRNPDLSFLYKTSWKPRLYSFNPSSISGEEFDGDLSLPSPVVVPITKFFPDTMEEKKAEVTAKWREVSAQMRVFTVNELTVINRKNRYPTVSERIETLLTRLIILYSELFDTITDKDGDEMKTEQDRFAQQESEIKEFLSSLEQCYYELEAEEDTASGGSVSGTDRNPTGLEQVMKAQLEDSKRREEKEE